MAHAISLNAYADYPDQPSLFARMRQAVANHRAYRRTLAELRDLPTRALRDLDFKRGDLATIAHRDVNGR